MDYGISFVAIVFLLPVFFTLIIISSFDTGFPGIFRQNRIGRGGSVFIIYKLRTYNPKAFYKIRNWRLDEKNKA